MTLSEEALSFQEKFIPELADAAFKQAYLAALASGSSVLISENGSLIEMFPDGKQRIIKSLPPPTPSAVLIASILLIRQLTAISILLLLMRVFIPTH